MPVGHGLGIMMITGLFHKDLDLIDAMTVKACQLFQATKELAYGPEYDSRAAFFIGSLPGTGCMVFSIGYPFPCTHDVVRTFLSLAELYLSCVDLAKTELGIPGAQNVKCAVFGTHSRFYSSCFQGEYPRYDIRPDNLSRCKYWVFDADAYGFGQHDRMLLVAPELYRLLNNHEQHGFAEVEPTPFPRMNDETKGVILYKAHPKARSKTAGAPEM